MERLAETSILDLLGYSSVDDTTYALKAYRQAPVIAAMLHELGSMHMRMHRNARHATNGNCHSMAYTLSTRASGISHRSPVTAVVMSQDMQQASNWASTVLAAADASNIVGCTYGMP